MRVTYVWELQLMIDGEWECKGFFDVRRHAHVKGARYAREGGYRFRVTRHQHSWPDGE